MGFSSHSLIGQNSPEIALHTYIHYEDSNEIENSTLYNHLHHEKYHKAFIRKDRDTQGILKTSNPVSFHILSPNIIIPHLSLNHIKFLSSKLVFMKIHSSVIKINLKRRIKFRKLKLDSIYVSHLALFKSWFNSG